MNVHNDFRPAFTLAEVLITLGIIGVVAAITIPGVMSKNYEKQTVSKLLEAQSILTQAVRQAEEEYGELPSWGITGQNAESAANVFNNLKPFLKIANDCGTYDKNGVCFQIDKYKTLNGGYNTASYAADTSRYKFSLLNGMSVSVLAIASTKSVQINVDTNGVSKPNIIGKDLFMLQYDEDSRSIVAMGHPDSLYPYTETCKKTASGYGCAYYVLQYKDMRYLYE